MYLGEMWCWLVLGGVGWDRDELEQCIYFSIWASSEQCFSVCREVSYVLFWKGEKCEEHVREILVINNSLNACALLLFLSSPKGEPSAIWKTWPSRTTCSLRALG